MADPLFSRGSMRSVLMSAAAQIIICRACLLDFRCLMNETPVQRNVSGRLVNGWGISLVRENRYTEFPWNLSAGVVGEHVFRNRVTARGRVHTKPTTCYPKPISKQKQRMISAFLPLITFDSTNLSRQSLRWVYCSLIILMNLRISLRWIKCVNIYLPANTSSATAISCVALLWLTLFYDAKYWCNLFHFQISSATRSVTPS